MTLAEIPQLERLTAEEKLALVEELWESISLSAVDLPVSDEEKALLHERSEAHRRAPETALTLEEFNRRVAQRL